MLFGWLTLPYLIRRSVLFDGAGELSADETKLKIRNELAVFTVSLLKEKQQQGLFSDAHVRHMLGRWEKKIQQPENFRMKEEPRQHYLEVLESQRQFLAGGNKDIRLDETFIRWQVYQIGLEEERIGLI